MLHGEQLDAASASGLQRSIAVSRQRDARGDAFSGPAGPCHTAYMPAMTASNTCAVQMFDVAFSRRMCCSRVCSVDDA